MLGATRYLLRISLMRCTQTSMPKEPLKLETFGTTMGALEPGQEALAVVLRLGDFPGSELGGDPRAAGFRTTKEPQLRVPGSAGGVTTDTGCSTWTLAAGGLAAQGSPGPSNGCRPLPNVGLRAWRGSSGLDSGPAPRGEKEETVCCVMRSGCGAAMPSRSKEGRRRLWEVLTAGGVGKGSETSVGDTPSPAKLRPRSGCGCGGGVGRSSSSGEARGTGKGCGRDIKRSLGDGSRRTAALGPEVLTLPSGPAGSLEGGTASPGSMSTIDAAKGLSMATATAARRSAGGPGHSFQTGTTAGPGGWALGGRQKVGAKTRRAAERAAVGVKVLN